MAQLEQNLRPADLRHDGGYALRNYDRWRRLAPLRDGRWTPINDAIIARHRQNIGVIIEATIHVEKANQKKIIVGEAGHMIRDIGTAARGEIAQLLGCGVHLSLFVRVDEEWTATAAGLRKMGYEATTRLGQPPAGTSRRPPPRRAAAPRPPRPPRAGSAAESRHSAGEHAK